MQRCARFQSWITAALLTSGLAVPLALQAQGVIDKLPDEDSFARASGKNVQPFFEGWQQLPDGRIAMWFGYLNRNYEEQPDIPIGADNKFDLREDMGQPTHFILAEICSSLKSNCQRIGTKRRGWSGR